MKQIKINSHYTSNLQSSLYKRLPFLISSTYNSRVILKVVSFDLKQIWTFVKRLKSYGNKIILLCQRKTQKQVHCILKAIYMFSLLNTTLLRPLLWGTYYFKSVVLPSLSLSSSLTLSLGLNDAGCKWEMLSEYQRSKRVNQPFIRLRVVFLNNSNGSKPSPTSPQPKLSLCQRIPRPFRLQHNHLKPI